MIYLLAGVPCSGKSWITNQVKDDYVVLEQDDYIGKQQAYIEAIKEANDDNDVIINTPFGVTELMTKLKDAGLSVIPVFIVEDEQTLRERYKRREGKDIPKGHLTRNSTYKERAKELRAHYGTSKDILRYFQG